MCNVIVDSSLVYSVTVDVIVLYSGLVDVMVDNDLVNNFFVICSPK